MKRRNLMKQHVLDAAERTTIMSLFLISFALNERRKNQETNKQTNKKLAHTCKKETKAKTNKHIIAYT